MGHLVFKCPASGKEFVSGPAESNRAGQADAGDVQLTAAPGDLPHALAHESGAIEGTFAGNDQVRRAEMAFGRRPGRLIRRLVELAQTLLPPSPAKLWSARDVAGAALKIGLRRRRSGPVCESVTREVRLDRLPALTCWPEDGGPFLTLPLVFTEHPERRGANLGIYRLQVFDQRTTGMHWQIGKGGGFHYAVAEGRNQRLPVTVFLGGPPALILAAIAPLPENVPEVMLASLIAGDRLDVCPGPGPHPLVAPAGGIPRPDR